MGILARDEISARLLSGDVERQIFRLNSGDLKCVRGAAYDLRVAPDYLILPDGRRYWPDAPDPVDRAFLAEFKLEPGQVAFVSSAERLCMPWDLAGNIAPKFRLALDGLLVMGGMLVDPGYGRFRADDGKWVAHGDGERLHFQLANLGIGTLKIVPNETSVAAIQFIDIVGDSRKKLPSSPRVDVSELGVPNSNRLLSNLFHPHANEALPQLAFFSRAAVVQERIATVEQGIETNQIQLEASERSNDRLVVFGLFLIAITLLGVIFAALINSLAS